METEISKLQVELEKHKKLRKKRFDLYDNDGITIEEWKEMEAELKTNQEKTESKIAKLKKRVNDLKEAKQECELLSDFIENIAKRAKSYSKEERQEIVRSLISDIFVNWDGIKERHDITIKFKLETVMEDKRFVVSTDGKNPIKPVKMNKAQFNAHFNPNPHVLTEKYDRNTFSVGDLSKQVVEPRRKP